MVILLLEGESCLKKEECEGMESANWAISKEGLSSHHNAETSLLPKYLPPPECYKPEIPPLKSF